ncbi:flagellar hook-associated protein FlgK [Meridianimarinicoccus sp. RP-17]|uniref:flagellar hook-associated protein FlgK n=1 Tax=Meridianimarinicoccus zhengii TaxID=2056810 RepID=UPI000DAB8F14|nr:flagellar hook-associated protein FlgK [Phycocomes zhengii]
MSGLLDIGRSGLLAYRTALNVTGENIANVETEGYRRRDIDLEEIAGARASILARGTDGQGVNVSDVRRAFDALLVARTNTATSALGRSDTLAAKLKALEDQMAPGAGGLIDMMDGMFDAMTAAAQAPDDTGLRHVVMTAADAFAGSVRAMADGMDTLRRGTDAEMAQAVDRANSLMTDLADLQGRMATLGDRGGRNPLLDQRDRMIGDLAELTDLTVSYDDAGIATLRFGATAGGPVMVDGSRTARLSLTDAGHIAIRQAGVGGAVQTRAPVGGALGGHAAAGVAVDAAVANLDVWAAGIASDMNAVHAQGLDAMGDGGGALFALDGWDVRAAPINRGTSFADVVATDAARAPEGPVTLVYEAALTAWQALDGTGAPVGSGAARIDVPGLSVEITGSPADGDILRLDATHGAAANMRFVPTDPGRIAAAARLHVSADPANAGAATLQATPSPPAATGLADLGALLGTAASPLTAVEFLAEGVAGIIPAGSQAGSLASLSVQAQAAFDIPPAAVGASTSLSFTLDGVSHDVDLTTDPLGAPVAPWGDMADLAAMLNDGTVVTGTGATMAELGLFAAGSGGTLTLAAARGEFGAATMDGTGGPFAAAIQPAAPDAGSLRLFTREGRQVSGPQMDPVTAAAFLTPANGFAEGAVYVHAPGDYRGAAISQAVTGGAHALAVDGGGLVTWTGVAAAPAAPARTLEIVTVAGGAATIAVPEGASARRVAGLVDAAVPVQAAASTHATLSGVADGALSFTLRGDNLQPIAISGDVLGGRLDDIAAAVNAASGQTGITADLSPDGLRMMLTHGAGADIGLDGVTHTAGTGVTLARTDAAGQSLGASVTLGGPGDTAARITGQVRLSGPSPFEAGYGPTASSARDPLAGGLVSVTTAAAGAQQTMAFRFDAALDGSHAAADGTAAVAAATTYTAEFTGGDGMLWTATADALADGIGSAADAAHAMAASFRSAAPTSRITGAALAAIPADGRSVAVMLGDQRYDIAMVGGVPQVSGPEPGRVLASFDASGRFVVETVGGDLDGQALRVPLPQGSAGAFGIDAAAAPARIVTGQPLDPATVPMGSTVFEVEVDGTAHDVTLTRSGAAFSVAAAAGFPGAASFDPAAGTVSLSVADPASTIRIPPQTNARHAGFATVGATLDAGADGLRVTATDGRVINLRGAATGLSSGRVALDGLPDEDLIAVMTGPGALNLAGGVTPRTDPALLPQLEITVLDADSGAIAVHDTRTGDLIGTRVIDGLGRARIGGFDLVLGPGHATGDSFHIVPNAGRPGDASNLEALGDLRSRDPATGAGGFAAIYDTLLSDLGGQVIAATARATADTGALESAQVAEAAAGAVDLDREAADLMKHQQAYQANAQVLNVARQLFDTLLNAI